MHIRFLLLLALLLSAPTPALAADASVVTLLQQSQQAQARGQFDQALQLVEKALSQDPAYPPLWTQKASLQIAGKDYAGAVDTLAVARKVEPDNVMANTLTLTALLRLDEQSGGKDTDLVRYLAGVNEKISGALILDLLSRPDAKADLTRFLAAWKPATDQDRLVSRLAAGYAAGDAAVMGQLAAADDAGPRKDVLAALQFYAGKRMLGDNNLPLAQTLLEKALAGGYDQVAVTGELGWVFLDRGEPAKAADLWEKDWRNAPDVGRWASWIADARLTAKEYKKASEFLATSLQFDPKNPVLQGRYIMALRVSDQADAASAFEDKLRDGPDQDGLHFGLALTAWNKGDLAVASEEMRRIKNRRPFRGQFIDLADAMSATIGKAGDAEKTVREVEALTEGLDTRASILRDVGWRLWAANRPDAALGLWKVSLKEGLPAGDPLLARVVPLLLESGKQDAAMALLKTYAPEISPLGLAWTLGAVNRWDLVGNVLKGKNDGPYGELLAGLAALRTGQGDLALEKLHALAVLPADGLGQATVTGFNADGKLVRVALSPQLAGKLYLRIGRALVDAQLGDGFFFLTPPAWAKNLPPKAMGGILADAGKVMWDVGRIEEAANFLEAALADDPGQNTARLYLALARKRQGRSDDAERLLAEAVAKASPFDREYALGEFAVLDGKEKEALVHFRKALTLAPNDDRMRLRVISLLAAGNNFTAAREYAAWYEARLAKGDRAVFGTAAAVRLEMGDPAGSESLYRALLAREPKSSDYLAGLGRALSRQTRYQETVDALSKAYAANKSPVLGAIVCEALMGLGRYEDVVTEAGLGLAAHPKDRELLRYAAEATEFTRDLPACEDYARRGLAIDPDSLNLQNLLGRVLLDQEKFPEAKEQFEAMLAKNPDHLSSLRGLLSVYQLTGKEAEAYKVAKRLHAAAPDDAAANMKFAIAAAADHRFRPAYPTLEKLREFGPGSGVLCLYYSDVRDADVPGKVRLSQMAAHLRALAAQKGQFLSLAELAERPTGQAARDHKDTDTAPQVLLLVDRTDAAVLDKIDTLLAEVGGKAVLVVGGESLVPATPYLPDAAEVARLVGTGRWSLALTDHNPPYVTGPGGYAVPLWSVAGAAKGVTDKAAMEARLTERLKALDPSGRLLGQTQPVFFYPGGNAPDELLVADAAARGAYTAVVDQHFPRAFNLAPEGFWTPMANPRLTAAKAVSPRLDVAGLENYLNQADPMHQVSLELAKVYSWQEQLGQADNYFQEAKDLKTKPEDLTSNHAVNAYYEHDDPVAVRLAEKALDLSPDSERAATQLFRAKLRTRPRAEASVDTWWDSDNRRYWWYGVSGEAHPRDDFMVYVRAGRIEWSIDSYQRRGQLIKAVNNAYSNGYLDPQDAYNVFNSRHTQYLNGEDLTLGARWFFRPEYWIEAQGQLTNTEDGPGTFPGGQITLHGPIAPKGLKVDGIWELQGAHERIDTVEAIYAQIMANRVSLLTHTRILDFWDLFVSGHAISRTDGNETGSVDGRLLRRLFEYPMFSVGYAFQFANSDRNPIEYWAPLDLATHLAYASFGYSPTRWYNLNGSVGYGPSRDRDNDWRNIWRVNAGMDITMKERLKLSIKYSYFSTPTYNLNEAWASISYIF